MSNLEDTTTAANGLDKATWQLSAITEALGDLTLTVEDSLSVGRGSDNDVILGSKEVSRNHALLSVLNGQLYVKDLNSSNGTSINNERIDGNQSKHLKAEDELGFAGFSFQVIAPDLASTSSMAASTDVVQPTLTDQPVSSLNNEDTPNDVADAYIAPSIAPAADIESTTSENASDTVAEPELTAVMEPAIDSPVEPVVVEETLLESVLDAPTVLDTDANDKAEWSDHTQQPVVKNTIINEVLSAGALSKVALDAKESDIDSPVTASESSMSIDEVTGMSNQVKDNMDHMPLIEKTSAETPVLLDEADLHAPAAHQETDAEHDKTTKTALQEEADPDVLRARQAATGQLSGTANLGQPRDLGTTGNNAMDQALTNPANSGNIEKKPSGSWFIWLFIIIIIIGIAVWFFNMGGA